MAINKTRLRTVNKWSEENAKKHISTIYIENDDSTGNVSARSSGSVDGLIHAAIGVLVDLAISGNVSLEEIIGKIIGLMCERKRRDAKNG